MDLTLPHLDLDQIAASGQCFLWRPLPGGGWGIPAHGRYLEARQSGDRLRLSCTPEEFGSFWQDYFDCGTDYAALKAAIDPQDAHLSAAVAYGGGIRVLRQDFWETLVSFLVSQNNNIARITRSVQSLSDRWGGPHALPTPDQLCGVSERELMDVGLGYRAKYLSRLARDLSGGGLDQLKRELDAAGDQEAQRLLMGLYGVGRKVADCVCLFGLHRVDFFPEDTHIKQIFAAHYPAGFPYERYRGYLGIVQQYLFYYDLKR